MGCPASRTDQSARFEAVGLRPRRSQPHREFARRPVQSWLDALGLSALGSRLEQATSEVVSNAVRHGEGVLKLVLQQLDGHVRIEVHDEGGGQPTPRPAAIDGTRLAMLEIEIDTYREVHGNAPP